MLLIFGQNFSRRFLASRRNQYCHNILRHINDCAVVACGGRRRVRGQGCAPEAALGVPLGELWPNAGSSEVVWSENCGKVFRFHAALRTRQMPNANATIYRGRRTADIVNIVAAIPCAFFTLTRYVMYSRRQLWSGHRNCWIELLTVSESDFSRLAVSRLRRRQVGSRECLRQRATARASLHFRWAIDDSATAFPYHFPLGKLNLR